MLYRLCNLLVVFTSISLLEATNQIENKMPTYESAMEYYMNKDYDKSRTEFVHAIKRNFSDPMLHYQYARLMWRHFGSYDDCHVARHHFSIAMNLCSKLDYIHPEEAKIHFDFAYLLFTYFKCYEQARSQYEIAITLDNTYVSAINNLGFLLWKHYPWNINQAIANFERVIALNPNHPEAHNFLGSIFFEHQNYDAAKQRFQDCVRINPMNYRAFYNLGLCFIKLNDTKAAITNFQNCLHINPQYVKAINKLRTL